MVHDNRHNNDGASYDPSDSDVYLGNDASRYNAFCASDSDVYLWSDASVYNAFCASDSDVYLCNDASVYGAHAIFCNAGKYVLEAYNADCANRDDHHILSGNGRDPCHGVYDASDRRHEQKIRQH